MRAALFYVLTVILFTACISNKKYERQMELAGNYQDKYNVMRKDSFLMARRIDSLMKDSADTHKKIDELSKIKGVSLQPPVKYKQQTITEEKEYKLKVIYLYNIANGTEWDGKYKKGAFVIGVLGRSQITAQLQKEFANKKKGVQDFVIKEFETVKDIIDCQLLFIAEGNYKNINAVKIQVKKFSTLLVSEEDYPASAAHFNLAVDGDAIKMNANRDLIKKAGFNVSKSLLNSAE